MRKSEFLNELEVLLEVPPGSLTGKEELESLASWDSLAVLAYIALVDSKCNLVVPANKIADCKTVDDLVSLAGSSVTA
jgi:acyl carrier protein